MDFSIVVNAESIHILIGVEADTEEGALRLISEYFTLLQYSVTVVDIRDGLLSDEEILNISVNPRVSYYLEPLLFQESLLALRKLKPIIDEYNLEEELKKVIPQSGDILAPFELTIEDTLFLHKHGIGVN